jgi:hypothetical protein
VIQLTHNRRDSGASGIEGAIAYGHGEEKKLQSTVAALKDKYAVASKAATEIRAQV